MSTSPSRILSSCSAEVTPVNSTCSSSKPIFSAMYTATSTSKPTSVSSSSGPSRGWSYLTPTVNVSPSSTDSSSITEHAGSSSTAAATCTTAIRPCRNLIGPVLASHSPVLGQSGTYTKSQKGEHGDCARGQQPRPRGQHGIPAFDTTSELLHVQIDESAERRGVDRERAVLGVGDAHPDLDSAVQIVGLDERAHHAVLLLEPVGGLQDLRKGLRLPGDQRILGVLSQIAEGTGVVPVVTARLGRPRREGLGDLGDLPVVLLQVVGGTEQHLLGTLQVHLLVVVGLLGVQKIAALVRLHVGGDRLGPGQRHGRVQPLFLGITLIPRGTVERQDHTRGQCEDSGGGGQDGHVETAPKTYP